MEAIPIVDIHIMLEKFPGKGGWTYAALPGVQPDKRNPFGWIKVKGYIDEVYIEQYHLMPMGNGQLFLPVKAAIRKKINKQAGDSIRVVLYRDDRPLQVPEELLTCLEDEPAALQFFNHLPDTEKKRIIDHIYSAKRADTRIERMAAAINAMSAGRLPALPLSQRGKE